MRKKGNIIEKTPGTRFPVRMIAAAVLTSCFIVGVAGEASAQRLNRPRYTEEEREAIRKEHLERIVDRLDLTKDQKERLLPLLEEGARLRGDERFARDRRGERPGKRAGKMARRQEEMAGRFGDRRCIAGPDGSYHNGKVDRPRRRPVSDACPGLAAGRGFDRRSFDRRPFRNNGPMAARRQEHRQAIEKILTKEQLEKLRDIRIELRKEMLEREASGDR